MLNCFKRLKNYFFSDKVKHVIGNDKYMMLKKTTINLWNFEANANHRPTKKRFVDIWIQEFIF